MRTSRTTIVITGANAALLAGAMLVDCKSGEPSEAPGQESGVESSVDVDTAVVVDDAPSRDGTEAAVEPDPTRPKDDGGGSLGWSSAPLLDGVTVVADRDAARVQLPSVDGAHDYRIFAIPAGVSVTVDAAGGETVRGTTIACAGFRQHNAPALPAPEVLRELEMPGIDKETRFVVEAIDTTCPFPGVLGATHQDVHVTTTELPPSDVVDFSAWTEAEIVARYGSMILNGHRPGSPLGAPADPIAPKVLARTTIKIAPHGHATKPYAWFDDFADDDPPAFVSDLPDMGRTQQGKLFQNGSLSFYTYGTDLVQVFVDRRRLNVVLADWHEEIFSSAIAYPKRTVQLSSGDYLHVHWRVASDATQRRYWWISLCGAETAGATMSADGKLLGNVIQTPFFYQDDGLDPSVEGWNCLQVFPRDGSPFPLPPTGKGPESDVRVMVNLAGHTGRDGVRNVSPPMYDVALDKPSWYRQRDATGALVAPILDDQILIAPTAALDLYVRRDRVIFYVDGQQRLCNDFAPVALTMAEGALGFGQVIYHSAAERIEFSRDYWLRTGQLYYLNNTPFVDARAWDDLGLTEHAPAPPGFDEGPCYAYAP